ncbi:hypothetical protein VPH35_093919 [Triticum aestivum]
MTAPVQSVPLVLNAGFPLPDLAGGESILGNEPTQTLVCTPAESSIDDAGDAALTVQLDVNSTCEDAILSAPKSEQSTGKDDPQKPRLTRRSVQGDGSSNRESDARHDSPLMLVARAIGHFMGLKAPEQKQKPGRPITSRRVICPKPPHYELG